ncbi:MAG TPA: S9 family peptidase [Woeseiaceae bacterium]|nr:S9 family peptidase [Woeseiaceae bacterium]
MNKGRDCLAVVAALLVTEASGVQAESDSRAAPVPAQEFARLPDMSDVSISPGGSHLAFLTPKDGRNHLVIQGLDESVAPVIVPPVSKLNFRWLHWANDDRLVFSVFFEDDRWGTETVETRLLAIDKDGLNMANLVRPSTAVEVGSRVPKELPPAQVQDSVVDWLPDQPQHILLSLDGDGDSRNEIRRVDIRDGSFTEVQGGLTGVQDWIVDQRGEPRFGYGYTDTDRMFRLKLASGEWVSTARANWPLGDYIPLAFTSDPAVAYGRGPDESGRFVIRKINLVDGEFLETVFEHSSVDVDGLEFDPVTGIAVGVAYTEHRPAVHYFDETMARLQRSVDSVLKNTSNAMVSMTNDRQRIVIFATSDVEPGTYYLWDRTQKTLDIIGEIHPNLGASALAPVEAVSYNARDGEVIPAYLTMPPDAGREHLPVVILPHGGPRMRDTQSYDFLPQFLASRGYAVFQPNFRGSSGYGDAFAAAGQGQWGGLMQDDVTDGVRWLVSQAIADPERVCIVGWSYGGYSAAIGAVKTPDLYRCAASINGVLDLAQQVSEDKEYIGGSVWTRHMGLDGESAKTVSPYHQAEKIVIPMLIIQAKDDARVTSEQGQRMARRLERLDKPVEYVEIEFGGHSLNNEAARLVVLESLESFLAAHIGGN